MSADVEQAAWPEGLRAQYDVVLGEHVVAHPTGATSVPGVWVAGHVTAPTAPVLTSAAAGMTAGSMITEDLVDDDTTAAVLAARAARERVPA